MDKTVIEYYRFVKSAVKAWMYSYYNLSEKDIIIENHNETGRWYFGSKIRLVFKNEADEAAFIVRSML